MCERVFRKSYSSTLCITEVWLNIGQGSSETRSHVSATTIKRARPPIYLVPSKTTTQDHAKSKEILNRPLPQINVITNYVITLKAVKDKFNTYFLQNKNTIFERFNSRVYRWTKMLIHLLRRIRLTRWTKRAITALVKSRSNLCSYYH